MCKMCENTRSVATRRVIWKHNKPQFPYSSIIIIKSSKIGYSIYLWQYGYEAEGKFWMWRKLVVWQLNPILMLVSWLPDNYDATHKPMERKESAAAAAAAATVSSRRQHLHTRMLLLLTTFLRLFGQQALSTNPPVGRRTFSG